MPSLYIVATPIGNLEDITFRALRTLKEVDFILAEDTRVARKLLAHYQITTPLISYHEHTRASKIDYLVGLLRQGKNLALVSDAGTPGISDPGGKLVHEVASNLGDKVRIVPVPGPSALTCAISCSGLRAVRFLFLGYLPHKKGRQSLLREIAASSRTVIFYEGKFRILKTLSQLQDLLDPERELVVLRELTKKFETIYRGNIKAVYEQVKNDPLKGEFVIMVEGGE